MSGLLYQKVYDYLQEFTEDQDDVQQCEAYRNTLSWCINNQVTVAMQKRQGTSPAIMKFYKLACEANSPLKILITGEFKTGKSTLINTLLGRQILKSDVLPTTAVATYICYGENEQLVVSLKDGSQWIYPLEQLKELTAEGNETFAAIRRQIEKVFLYLPLAFLRHITLIDSPGINVDISYHVEATKNLIDDVDMVFWVMSISQAAKKGEIGEIRNLPKYLKPVVIFNGIDLIDPEEERVENVIKNAGNRVAGISRCCFGVSAYQAQKALEENDEVKLKESNWLAFRDFLLNDICKKWYLWKTDAMKERWLACRDSEVETRYYELKKEQRESELSLSRSAMKNWLLVEGNRAVRRELREKIDFILEDICGYDRATGTVKTDELEKLGGLMRGIGLMIQENQVISVFSREEIDKLSAVYQNYQQQWYYLNYYSQIMQNTQGTSEYGDYLEQVVSTIAAFNRNYAGEYQSLNQKLDAGEEQFFQQHMQEWKEYKELKNRCDDLSNRLETQELFQNIKQQMEYYYST